MASRKPTTPISLGHVLVIGGCGFLGRHIVDQLLNFPSETTNPLAANYPSLKERYPTYNCASVSVVDLRTANGRLPGATYYDGDVTSEEAMLEIFKKTKPDVVIHTASPSMVGGTRALFYKVNVEGTKNLLEVAGGQRGDWGGKCRAFVYTSSASVVHDTQSDLINVDERWPYVRGSAQKEYYSETKADAEELVLKANGQYNGMLTTAIRPAGIMGEHDVQYTKAVIEHCLKASPFVLRMQLGSNNNLFEFTYVGNIALGHMLAAARLIVTYERAAKGMSAPLDYERVDGEAFNITNDSPVYFWDMTHAAWAHAGKIVEPSSVIELGELTLSVVGGILESIYALVGKTPRLTRRTVRYSCMTRYFSCEKAKTRLGYWPAVPVDEGIKRAVDTIMEKERSGGEKKAN